MLFSTWAWNVICAPDVFTWNFAFMLLNMAQVFHILYQLRPVKFDPELEEVYHNLFYPFKVVYYFKYIFLNYTHQHLISITSPRHALFIDN